MRNRLRNLLSLLHIHEVRTRAIINRLDGRQRDWPPVLYPLRSGLAVIVSSGLHDARLVNEIFGRMVYPKRTIASLPARPVVLDIGANKGLFSLYCINLRRDAIIYAYEPDAINRSYFAANVGLNAERFTSGGVELFASAISSETGTRDFYVVPGRRGLNSFFGPMRRDRRVSEREVMVVETLALREVLESHGSIDLMKVDAEGAEYEIILSIIRESLPWEVRRILAEVDPSDPRNSDFRSGDLLQELATGGYEVEWLIPNRLFSAELRRS